MTSTQPRRLETASGPSRRLPALLVGLLTAVALVAVGAPNAAAQTRVGPQHQNVILTVGPQAAPAQNNTGAKGLPLRQHASATGVAAETGGAASGLERTGSALKSDVFHRSVSWVVDNPSAQRFAIRGGDGVSRDLYQLLGEVNGKSGVFEWIIDRSGSNPAITHQRFIPGGGITGLPNQVVP